MSTIRVLPDQVANRIAAGEVIERPVAVVKELVDNSIDAGATRIRIQFKQGGKSLILVEDNGKGMDADDAMLCLERHATSKIRSSDDLFNITTLGFRGEAIPSIGSVSRFLLKTRPEDQVEGTEILVNGGKLIHKKSVGIQPGTRIEVTHLFSSIPARRKFLKTDNTEASHIIQWIRWIALAHHPIAFRLLSNDRTLLSVPQHETFLDRILTLWGREFESKLKEIAFEQDGIKAYGYIGEAGVSRPSRHDIITIVNGRPVESRTLGFALTEAYHTHIPKGRYPLVFLKFDVDPALIDVNIHPSKREIKFKNEARIRSLLIHSVWDVLKANATTGTAEPIHVQAQPADPVPPVQTKPSSQAIPTHPSAVSTAPSQHPAPTNRSIPEPKFKPDVVTPSARMGSDSAVVPAPKVLQPQAKAESIRPVERPKVAPASASSSVEKEWRFIGSYRRSYSLFERASGLTLVHSTRALRRIGYENILTALQDNTTSVQREMVPATLELESHLSIKLEKWIPQLMKCGIVVEPFGRNFFRIESVPSMLESAEASVLIEAWLHRYEGVRLELQSLSNDIALQCCGSFQNQLELPLGEANAKDILRQLLACSQPMVDPDGRPVVQHIPHRMFENLKTLESLTTD